MNKQPTELLAFVKADIYVRKELHNLYGGQRQGGISTPVSSPAIFLFTGEAGQEHGYGYDGWQSPSLFHYTGEGQKGDMAFVRGNRAIRDHEHNGRRLFLFQKLPKGEGNKGEYRFVDEMRCMGWHMEQRDSSGIGRNVIVFELVPSTNRVG